jgi:hypothetical protein
MRWDVSPAFAVAAARACGCRLCIIRAHPSRPLRRRPRPGRRVRLVAERIAECRAFVSTGCQAPVVLHERPTDGGRLAVEDFATGTRHVCAGARGAA